LNRISVIRIFVKTLKQNVSVMKKNISSIYLFLACMLGFTILTAGDCNKDEDPPLPQINGYNNSNEVGAANLKVYIPLDGNANETKTGATATSAVGVSYSSTGAVKGQAATFNNGYIYYASAVGGPLADNQPFSVSLWVQAANTGLVGGNPPANNHPWQFFTYARPGQFWGNINILNEAGQFPVASDTMFLKALYSDAGGLQDNVNNYGIAGTEYKVVKKAGTGQWANIVVTYNPAGGTGAQSIFRIYTDSVLVSNINFENRGSNSFDYTTHELILGGWYNNIPGKQLTADTWTTPFTGKMDEVRVWNKTLTQAEISALYKLGLAGR
jgi:hypothetical protein